MKRPPDWIAANAVRTPDAIATVDLHTGRRLTYRDINARANRLAHCLQTEWKVRPGDRIALLAHNSADCFELLFACRRAGAIFVPLNWRLAQPELSAILVDMAPRVVLYDSEFAPVVKSLQSDGAVLVDREAGQAHDRACSGPDPATALTGAAGGPVAAILYTSGSSGRPKGVLVTDEMLHANALNISGPARITSGAMTLVILPTFHAGGLNLYATPTLYAGGTIVVQRRFDAAQALALLADQSSGITHFFGVPTNYLAMSVLPAFSSAWFAHLTTLGVGGAPPSAALLRVYRDHGAELCNGYGMTETGPVVLTTGHDVPPLADADVGRPVRHAEVQLDGNDGGSPGAARSGELLVRGPAVSPGYWSGSADDRPREPGAWFRTGDIARRDDDGRYYIVDRAKNMYISGGENVYPAEIENVLLELPGIAETAVVGVADDRWGEVGAAAIVLQERSPLTATDIVAYCAQRLAAYKVPRHIELLDELPHNSTGKIARTEVRKLLDERSPAGRAGSAGPAAVAAP